MNLVLSLLFGAVLVGGQGEPSLYRQVIPNPTGINGYEEYLRAADLVNDRLATAYYNGDSTLGPYQETPQSIKTQRSELIAKLNRADYLDAQRLTLKQYGAALDLVEAGNQKPFANVHDPLVTQKVSELSHFLTLGHLFTAKAYVQAAEGNQSGSIHSLLDAMTFGARVQTIAGSGAMFGGLILTDNLHELKGALLRGSLADVPPIHGFVNAYLAMPSNALRVVQDRLRWGKKAYADAIAQPQESLGFGDKTPLDNRLEAATPDERRQILEESAKYLQQSFEQKIADLNAPEAEWYDRSARWDDGKNTPPISQDSTIPDLGRALFFNSAGSYRNYVLFELRLRCQMRILDLYADVVSFRWKKKRLPSNLEELGEPSKLADPLSGASFVYERQEDGFRIYSKGRPESGQVDLDYTQLGLPQKNEP